MSGSNGFLKRCKQNNIDNYDKITINIDTEGDEP